MRPSSRSTIRVLAATVVAVFALASGPVAEADPPEQAQRRVDVMTYNLYLGADLSPLFDPQVDTLPELIAAAAGVFAQTQQTDFPARAEVIAREIAEQSPSLIGLQEVAIIQTAAITDPGTPLSTLDFLDILLTELEERGAHYESVATNVNFSGTLPISPTTLATLTDRSVILARTDLPTSQLALSNPTSNTFEATLTLSAGGVPLEIIRGWSSIDVKLRGKSFRFVNTHLEAFHPVIRQLQAAELIEWMGDSPLPILLAGDLNTLRGDPADAYGLFVDAGFVDAWVDAMPGDPGFTAGQAADLMGPSLLDHTVDYVMYEGFLDAVTGSGEIIGEEDPADRTPSGLWPSDHAGVNVAIHVASP
ncbi:MAG TPA: endonuclease/exonuclease/phosphatase family protein [Actinomycetota bacterium]